MIVDKPQLATDWDPDKIKFPVFAQPKIDGVRGINIDGILTGRSLKTFKNRFTTSFYSHALLSRFDGELIAASPFDPACCRKTTSALGTIEGQPFTQWHLFDDLTKPEAPYQQRYEILLRRIEILRHSEEAPKAAGHLIPVPFEIIQSIEELDAYDEKNLEQGYEGTILRNIRATHKNGRCTVREGNILRIKRFIEEEARVVSITEGQSNQNEATTSLLGYTERSSHQENMVPNGMVGSLECIDIKTGQPITVAAGSMPHNDRVFYFQNQNLLIGMTIKYKHFPKGVKDKPRFPTFQCIRMEADK